ncbi:catechol O-methyltransferase [Sphaerosporella brunnea]|uniref:catechol O-methyltransferase n=1 Tax=Sphaerosporella brunnea TaxID=1250544 RepID=A0A5J5F1L8_9PEZI|nr:catechol O-methyltransferase [Sphaerosporella brunnea]
MVSTSFTSSHRYGEQGEVFFNDGRELELLQRIFSQPPAELSKLRNNPRGILSFIDNFATQKYLMNVGELKGKHVTALLRSQKPSLCVELGGYVGYSTILFGSTVAEYSTPSNPARYYCLEYSPVFGAIIMALIDLAGLSDVVKVVIGSSTDSLNRLHGEGALKGGVDFMFLDHNKPLYMPDLKLCESLGVVRGGTVLVADNMVKPGNPPYHRYVNLSPEEKKKEAEGKAGAERGDPELRYENKWIESWEPSAVPDALEVSRCLGRV